MAGAEGRGVDLGGTLGGEQGASFYSLVQTGSRSEVGSTDSQKLGAKAALKIDA